MKRIALDGAGWRSRSDFYAALLPALGAAEWVGGNLDALFDSFAGNTTLAPPYAIEVRNVAAMPAGELAYIRRAGQVFADARAAFGIDIWLTFAD